MIRRKRSPSPSKGKAGRRIRGKSQEINRSVILKTAYQLSRTIPLRDVSIVLVARTLRVSAPLLYYYVENRDALTSGVMNTFYRDLVEALPEPTGKWAADLRDLTRIAYGFFCQYRGIASYALSHNPFRIIQRTWADEEDFGLLFLEKLTCRVMAAGCSRARTAIYGHMFLEFIISSAHSTVSHRLPGEHREVIEERIFKLDIEKFPGINYTRDEILQFNAAMAFEEGYSLLSRGLEMEAAAAR